jgi:hypothetical protein
MKTTEKDQQTVELIMWETVKKDCKYPDSDDNDGYIFGINLIDTEGEGDIMDVQWFKTNKERNDFIKNNNLKILED